MKYQMKVQTALATQQQPFLTFKRTSMVFLQTNLHAARGSVSEEQPSHTDNTSAGAEEY